MKNKNGFIVNKFEFTTLEEAWEGINEYLLNREHRINKHGGGNYGTEMVSYDNYIYIYRPYIRPKFNFGVALGYRYKKWSKLVNNYVNMDYLDLVKSEVNRREKKKGCHYNYTFHFDNKHGSGKDCLISLSFCRRRKQENPYVIYTTRASEATSRLIFDFLLIQRMVEYVYGKEIHVEVLCFIPFLFINIERVVMYMGYKGRDIVKRYNGGEFSPYQDKCLAKYDEYDAKDITTIRYRVHKRAAMQVKRKPDGSPLANIPDLFAEDLKLPHKHQFKFKDKDIVKLDKNQTI